MKKINNSDISNYTVVIIMQQLIATAKESARLIAKGYLVKGFYWFYVKNKISLLCDSNSGDKKFYDLKNLNIDGFQKVDPLSDELTEQLVKFFLKNVGYKALSEYFEGQRHQPFIRASGVRLDEEDELLKKIFNQTKLNKIASQYLNLPLDMMCFSATIDSLSKILVERKLKSNYDDAVEFHRDIDSLRFVKAYIYLNDIEVGSGHHEVFLKSHRNIPVKYRVMQRFSQEELIEAMPNSQLLKVTGKKGFAWIENTTSFHRGTRPTTGDRLILTFSFNDKKTGSILCGDLTPF